MNVFVKYSSVGTGLFAGGESYVVDVSAAQKITRDRIVGAAVGSFEFERRVRCGVLKHHHVRPRPAVKVDLRKKNPERFAKLLKPPGRLPKLIFTGIADQKEIPAPHFDPTVRGCSRTQPCSKAGTA